MDEKKQPVTDVTLDGYRETSYPVATSVPSRQRSQKSYPSR